MTKQEQTGAEVNDFLTVHIHRTSSRKERVWYPGKSGKCVLTGAYTNKPQVLVRYDVTDPADKYLVLVLSQYDRSDDLGYTLSCYCTENFSFGRQMDDHVHRREISAALNQAGGPIGTPAFKHNPMFGLSVTESNTTLQFLLSVNKTIALNVLMFPVNQFGQGIKGVSAEKPIVDSGNYRHCFVATPRQLIPPGNYVAIVSSFTPSAVAPFRLETRSSRAIQAKAL